MPNSISMDDMYIKQKARLIAKFTTKVRLQGDAELQTLENLDDYAAQIYRENRIKMSFEDAKVLSYESVIMKILSDDFINPNNTSA